MGKWAQRGQEPGLRLHSRFKPRNQVFVPIPGPATYPLGYAQEFLGGGGPGELGSQVAKFGEDLRLLGREQEAGDFCVEGPRTPLLVPPQAFRLPPTHAQRVAMATSL